MKNLTYILLFFVLSNYAQINQDNCRLVVAENDSLRLSILNINCNSLYMDSRSYLEVDSLFGSGWIYYGRKFENDTVNANIIVSWRYRQYHTPLFIKDQPTLIVNEFLSDSIKISPLIK